MLNVKSNPPADSSENPRVFNQLASISRQLFFPKAQSHSPRWTGFHALTLSGNNNVSWLAMTGLREELRRLTRVK
jgi:hypothetical protein